MQPLLEAGSGSPLSVHDKTDRFQGQQEQSQCGRWALTVSRVRVDNLLPLLTLVVGFPDGRCRKRNLDAIENASSLGGRNHPDGETPSFNASSALSALGYMPHTHHAVLGRGSGPMVTLTLLSRVTPGISNCWYFLGG
jgi:hypothetical protein